MMTYDVTKEEHVEDEQEKYCPVSRNWIEMVQNRFLESRVDNTSQYF